ncbi:hypothetical protein IE81DRAFT_349636 [Ceraceosorus guamensis]|uniref:Nudix hydrolase domain-containing protein n=1 Tax=Ceraceosorus guamensis TaxID=1522189 RepID=A0A316VR89_9BASI|nr:hypothetical protein IE81DRAFT_349636 [Ceraceosorus guamensis]PWN40032.1 hypothetical protein IE81DRAFT_349636 [Ceraceosorus guamensis]
MKSSATVKCSSFALAWWAAKTLAAFQGCLGLVRKCNQLHGLTGLQSSGGLWKLPGGGTERSWDAAVDKIGAKGTNESVPRLADLPQCQDKILAHDSNAQMRAFPFLRMLFLCRREHEFAVRDKGASFDILYPSIGRASLSSSSSRQTAPLAKLLELPAFMVHACLGMLQRIQWDLLNQERDWALRFEEETTTVELTVDIRSKRIYSVEDKDQPCQGCIAKQKTCLRPTKDFPLLYAGYQCLECHISKRPCTTTSADGTLFQSTNQEFKNGKPIVMLNLCNKLGKTADELRDVKAANAGAEEASRQELAKVALCQHKLAALINVNRERIVAGLLLQQSTT